MDIQIYSKEIAGIVPGRELGEAIIIRAISGLELRLLLLAEAGEVQVGAAAREGLHGGEGVARGDFASAPAIADLFQLVAYCRCRGTELKNKHVGRFGTALGELDRIREDRVLAIEIGLADPTGLRAAASYVERDALLLRLADQLLEGREADGQHHIEVPILDQHRGITRQVDLRLDAGLGRPIDGEMDRHTRFGWVVWTMGADVDELGHDTASFDHQ